MKGSLSAKSRNRWKILLASESLFQAGVMGDRHPKGALAVELWCSLCRSQDTLAEQQSIADPGVSRRLLPFSSESEFRAVGLPG